MSPGIRSSTRAKAIPRAAIEQAESFLQELPKREKENLSVSEAISGMADTVRAALAKGYSYNEVSEMLSDKLGINVSAWSLRRYIPAGIGRGKRSKAGDGDAAPKRGRRKKENAHDLNGATPAAAQAISAPSTTIDQPPVNNTILTVDTPAEPASRGRRGKTAAEAKPAPTNQRTRGQSAAKSSATTKAKTTRNTRKKS